MSTILVIGALGNVGAEVVQELLARGARVRAADIDVARLKARFGGTVEAVHFDFSDPDTFAAAFRGVENMFLLRPPQISDVRRLMFPAIDAVKRAGVGYVVFLSLIGIEKLKVVPHYKVEQYLEQAGLQTTFLRCSFFMQNLNTAHRREIRERSEIVVPVGKARTSFVDVRDIGAVAAAALTEAGHAGQNYDLTGQEALDYWTVAEIMSVELGRRITYRNPHPLQFLIQSMRSGVPWRFALVMLGLYTSTRFGMAESVTDEIQRLIRREPISFRQYVKDYREMWIQREAQIPPDAPPG